MKTRGYLRSDGQTVNRLFRCQGVRKARYEMSLWRSQSQKAYVKCEIVQFFLEAGSIKTMLNAQDGNRDDRRPQTVTALTLPEWSRGRKTEPRDSEMAVQVWER